MKAKKLLLGMLCIVLLAGLSVSGFAQKKTIAIWTFTSNNFEELKARKAELEAKFKIKVKYELLTQEAMITRLQSAMATGQGWPDIVDCMYDMTRQLANSNPKKAALVPLNKYVKKSAVVKKVVKSRIDRYTINGHIYGLPNDIHPSLLIYNDEAWKKGGVDLAAVQTWDDFFAAAKQVCPNPAKNKVYPLAGGSALYEIMLQQSGVQLLNKKGNPILTSKALVNMTRKYVKYNQTRLIMDWDWQNFWNLMSEGKLLSTIAPDWWLDGATKNLAKTKVNGKMHAIPLPAWVKGGPRTATWGGSFKAIPRGAGDPDFSYQIIEWLQYAPEAIKSRYVNSGIIAPISSVWNDPVFQQPNPVFGGQKVAQLQIEMAKQMPSYNNGDLYFTALAEVNAMNGDFISGKKSVAKGLAEAQARVKKAAARIKK
jgi:ABC-type glycerol-3-phosphate transport system substrate-binding protein